MTSEKMKTYAKEWRVAVNMTLDEVSEMINMPLSTLSNKENGRRQFTPAELDRLAGVYECEPWQLTSPPLGHRELEQGRKIKAIRLSLTPNQIDTWIMIGESMMPENQDQK